MTVRTRFAPSPTGYLHIGGARTALFSWLYARKHGGSFVLRIEDTDLERSTKESVNAILESMTWLGLDYDEGPFYQTDRFARYKEVIQKLLDEDKAYKCYCSKERLENLRAEQMANKQKPRYDRHCLDKGDALEGQPFVIRFRNPAEGTVEIHDIIKGKVEVDNHELDDLIIARTDGTPTYNLTVVVDDLDMNITHVIRGDDHLNNTPRQINILNALGAEPPQYAHVPMILGSDGKRLSKRHGAVSVLQYREEGYLPEALLNYLVRLGWSYGDQEVFSSDEMMEFFDLKDVNRAASTFNPEKLLWLNHQYMMSSDPAQIARHLSGHMEKLGIDPATGPDLVEVVKVQRERAKTLVELANISAFYYQDFEAYNKKAAKKAFKPAAIEVLEKVKVGMLLLQGWSQSELHALIEGVVETLEVGFGKVGMPLRLAVTGGAPSPELEVTLYLIGKDTCLRRIDQAIEYIGNAA